MDNVKAQIFVRLLFIHIRSLTTWTQFHLDTEKAYERAFDVLHLTEEMLQALGQQPTTDSCEDWQEAYNLIEELRQIIKDDIKSNKDEWYDDELRWLSRIWTKLSWKFLQYTEKQEEEEEKETTNEETKETQKSKLIPNQ